MGRAVREDAGLDNPWGVNGCEARVMDAFCELGRHKTVGAFLGLSPRTVECHILHARLKMQCNDAVVAAIRWDRFRRPSLAYKAPEGRTT